MKKFLLSSIFALTVFVPCLKVNAAVTITTPTVNSGELIRASDWNKVRSDLITISSAIDILSNQLWNSSGGDMYYTNGQVGVGTAVPPAQFSVHKESPAANEKLFQIGTGADADKANIDEDGDLQIDGTLLVRGGTVYDSSGALELNGEDNVYISMDWNNNDNDNRALIIGKNAPGPGGNWAELMKIQENGRVGIGVSSPTTELEVNGRIQASVSNGTDAAISSVSTVTNGQGVSGVSSGQNGIGVYGNAMGQYGIGIYGNADASAEYSTSIYGMNYSTTGTAVRGTAQASSGYVFGVWGESYSPNGVGVFAKSEHPASTPLVVEGNNSQTGDLAKFNSGPGTTVLTVNASGKVGIGTTNPSHALQVVGDMKVNGGASDDGLIISNATDSLRIKTYAGAQDTARFSSTGGGGDMMTLNLGNGNIGIGTTAPDAKLDVAGVIDLNSNKIVNVATPTAANDAANKAYVDSVVGGGGAPEYRVYTSSTTWTKPAGLTAVIVEAVGGGGGGNHWGHNGAASSFGSHCTANGGAGGRSGGGGAGASGGDLNLTGERGSNSFAGGHSAMGGQYGRGGLGNDGGRTAGGGGGYCKKRIAASSLGPTVTVTVGSGGSGDAGGRSGVVIVTEYY